MPKCMKCSSPAAYWTIQNRDNNIENYCDPCFQKHNLFEYKKEMDAYHEKVKQDRQKEQQSSVNKEGIRKAAPVIKRGGVKEPYCSDNCYSEAGKEISNRVLVGTNGVCAFCQKPVYASLNNAGNNVVFPFKRQLFFICKSCFPKGKEYVKTINECCMCGKPLG